MGSYMNFLFNPNGRVSRKDIWIKFFLVSALVNIVAGALDLAMGFVVVEWFGLAVSLFYFWPSIAVPVKRFHDRGMTGWWVLFGYIGMTAGLLIMLSPILPSMIDALETGGVWDEGALQVAFSTGSNLAFLIVGMLIIFGVLLFFFIVNYCLPGHEGVNKYGPDPLNPLGDTADAFN